VIVLRTTIYIAPSTSFEFENKKRQVIDLPLSL
jgi:hypothetical protein